MKKHKVNYCSECGAEIFDNVDPNRDVICAKCVQAGLNGGYPGVEYLGQRLGIQVGDTKEQAIERFLEWRDSKKTCERCLSNNKKYGDDCPICLICKQADEEVSESEGKDGGALQDQPVDQRREPGQEFGGVQADFVSIP